MYFDENLSYNDYPAETRQVIYTIFAGFTFKWAVDLMASQDWGNFTMIGLLALVLLYQLFISIRNKRRQNINEQDYLINATSYRINNAIQNIVKESVKEGIKEGIKEANNQQTTIELTKAVKELTQEIKKLKGEQNAKKD
jgi:hypothetical protein